MPKDNDEQMIYLLGTLYHLHEHKDSVYPLSDIQSAIEIINPDVLLVEDRQDLWDDYEITYTAQELCWAWHYALEKGIAVRDIDSWD